MSRRQPPGHCFHTVLAMPSPGGCPELHSGYSSSPQGEGRRQGSLPSCWTRGLLQLGSRFFQLSQAVPLCPGNLDPQRSHVYIYTRAQVHTHRPSTPPALPFSHSQLPHPRATSFPKSILYTTEPWARTGCLTLAQIIAGWKLSPFSQGRSQAAAAARTTRSHSNSSLDTCPSGNVGCEMSGGRNTCMGHCTNSAYVCTRPCRSVHACSAD